MRTDRSLLLSRKLTDDKKRYCSEVLPLADRFGQSLKSAIRSKYRSVLELDVGKYEPFQFQRFTIRIGKAARLECKAFYKGFIRVKLDCCKVESADNSSLIPDELFHFLGFDSKEDGKPYLDISDEGKARVFAQPLAKYLERQMTENVLRQDWPARAGWSYAEVRIRAYLWQNDSWNWINWHNEAGVSGEIDIANPEEKIAIEYQGVGGYHRFPDGSTNDQQKKDRFLKAKWSVIWFWNGRPFERLLDALGKVRKGSTFVVIE